MKTALLIIATGEKYRRYADGLIASAEKFFVPHDIVMWGDGQFPNDADIRITKPGLGYPQETLHRYNTFMRHSILLNSYDQLFYIDADMEFVSEIRPEYIFSEGITATLHPGYVGTCGTPERDPRSTACLPPQIQNAYYCGGFVGGKASEFLRMANRLATNVLTDDANHVIARWHDESHLNRYLCFQQPAKILSPEYCYPENFKGHYESLWAAAGLTNLKPKILALAKDSR